MTRNHCLSCATFDPDCMACRALNPCAAHAPTFQSHCPTCGHNVRWIPQERPYRVVYYSQSAGNGLYGWDSSTRTIATEDEGRAAVAAKMGAGVYRVVCQRVELDDRDFPKAWHTITSRERRR